MIFLIVSEESAVTSKYWKNRLKIPAEEFAKCYGKWIALHPQGTHIVASHHDLKALMRSVEEKGEDPEEVHVDYVEEHPEELSFGGIELH